jgi:hypothetical protein
MEINKNKLGKITYLHHTGIVLSDGRTIQDLETKHIFKSSLKWVYHWDVKENRKPPILINEIYNPINPVNTINQEKCNSTIDIYDDDDDDYDDFFVLDSPIDNLINEMENQIKKLRIKNNHKKGTYSV